MTVHMLINFAATAETSFVFCLRPRIIISATNGLFFWWLVCSQPLRLEIKVSRFFYLLNGYNVFGFDYFKLLFCVLKCLRIVWFRGNSLRDRKE